MKKIVLFTLALCTLAINPVLAYDKKEEPKKSEKKNNKLEKGLNAPDFSAKDSDGKLIKLSDFKNKNAVLLVFYPGDNTPGCTKQLCDIRDDFKELKKLNVKVFGVNQADEKSHKSFIKAQNYPFTLLVDSNYEITKSYDAMGMFGFINRTVVLVNKEGKIALYERGMPDVSAKKIKNLL